ncbi:hypothetical protein K435DRAFT_659871 [Dendrothele bispora CBS 962.96]|uniref:S-adenosyl-L-methionine-dependent methyltransferase n=1 Tax=Dendrothele bispora (strain CBS 962.96) TaxID=1314807 RepID=A0A4S8M9B6_DENBC|nr:hypothetical protein K435DRAFT_659871 [Dendrothele bispora CBS 962.96]
MKLSNAFAVFTDLRSAIKAAFWPTLRAIFARPSLLFRPSLLSQTFMANVWLVFAGPTDEGGRAVKQGLITANAYGTVLDIGAGLGHTIAYLDHTKVTRYVALEPSVSLHEGIRQTANNAGYTESDGSLVILSCGAGDTLTILEVLNNTPVDTMISILVACSVPSAENTFHQLFRDVLCPGGQFLFYEHVLSPRADVAWWQRLWTPLWALFFDGCRLDVPSHLWFENMRDSDTGGQEISMWKDGQRWGKPGEDEENLWWHQAGRYVKHT